MPNTHRNISIGIMLSAVVALSLMNIGSMSSSLIHQLPASSPENITDVPIATQESWQTFTTPDGNVSFEYPSDWVIPPGQESQLYTDFFKKDVEPIFGGGDTQGNEVFSVEYQQESISLENVKDEYFPTAILTTIHGKPALETSFGRIIIKPTPQTQLSLSVGMTDQETREKIIDSLRFE